MTAPAIGLLGIGNIGTVFAECLLRTGHQVIGFSKPAPACFGGTLASSPRAVADAAPLVLCCLPDEAAATDAYFGDTGLLAGVHPGSIIADLATYTLAFKQRLADAVAAAGGIMVDGEVSGTPDMLRAGGGTVFLGGEPAACERVKQACLTMVAEVFVLGPFGAANRMKLINNLLSAVHVAAAGEAMALGVKAGFEPTLLAKVLATGSGSSKYLVSRGPMMAQRAFAVHSGALKIFAKYLDYIPVLANEVGAGTPMFDAAKRCFEVALAEGHGDEDIAVVYEAIAEMKV
jgi:3-hydroxyisobutyrate dehydrogenase